MLRRFELHRDEDESGVSGLGRVAQGIVFEDGTACLHWLTKDRSTGIYDSVDALRRIHGHGGKTRIVYMDPPERNISH